MIGRRGVSSLLLPIGAMGLAVATAICGSMPVGALMGSKNATVDGQAPLPHTTLLSGDSLHVNDGIAMVTLDQGNRMALGQQTDASFQREADAVTVSLARGSLALYHPQASRAFQIKAGDVTVAPVKGYRTVGELAMADGFLAVSAKDGTLQVEKAGTTQQVPKGSTITIATTPAGAPEPSPAGNPHLKHLYVSPALLLALGLGAGAGLTAWAIVSTSGGKPTPVSPVVP